MTGGNDPGTAILELRTTVEAMKTTVSKLERAVQGDQDVGTPSIRQVVKSLADDLANETDALCDRVDKLEHTTTPQADFNGLKTTVEDLKRVNVENQAYLRGVTNTLRWLGVGTLGGLIAILGQLFGLFGGTK